MELTTFSAHSGVYGWRQWLLPWVLLSLFLFASTSALAAPNGEKRMALVIGNARYPTMSLTNPENDARVMASALRRLGFDVTEKVNLGVKEFRKVLRDYARKVEAEEGASVFYYAGHGVQIDGRNYLLPVDINLRDEYEIRDEGVDINELYIGRLERARSQVRIVILDACRDNPFTTQSRGSRGVGGLAEMAARGALIAYATAPGATAEDGPPGTNSVFTRHLAKEMLTEGVEVEQMFKNVRVKVMRDTQERQIPWVNTSMTRNFSFNPALGNGGDDEAKREDLARLQALLGQREREQKKLEEQLQQLSRQLADKQNAVPSPVQAAVARPQSPPTAPLATATLQPDRPALQSPAELLEPPPRPSAVTPKQVPSPITTPDASNAEAALAARSYQAAKAWMDRNKSEAARP
ncbi:MAG: caspase family protein, partial [Burkholderiales bacterium]